MLTVQISLQGADSAHRKQMRQKSSRLWRFPDDIERVITISNWHWLAFDQEVAPFMRKSFIADVFRMAKHEYQLQLNGLGDPNDPILTFEGWIHQTAADYIRVFYDTVQEQRCINDNQ